MFLQAMLDFPLDLLPLLAQLVQSAGVFFGGIGGHLAAIDGEQLMTQQALLVTDQQYLLEYRLNRFGIAADKAGNTRKVRNRITGEGLKDNVVLALPLDLPTGSDALGVGEQNYFKQNRGVVSRTATGIVAVMLVEL